MVLKAGMSCRPLCVILVHKTVILVRIKCLRAFCLAYLIDFCCLHNIGSLEWMQWENIRQRVKSGRMHLESDTSLQA